LRQLGVGLAVPSRPVPYGIVTLRYAYSEKVFMSTYIAKCKRQSANAKP